MEDFYSTMGTNDFNKNEPIEIIETNDSLNDNIEIIEAKSDDIVEEKKKNNNLPDLNNVLVI